MGSDPGGLVPSVPRVLVGILMGSTPRVVTGGPLISGEFAQNASGFRGVWTQRPSVRKHRRRPRKQRFGWSQQKCFWKGSHPVDLRAEQLGSVWTVFLPKRLRCPPALPVCGCRARPSSASAWICWRAGWLLLQAPRACLPRWPQTAVGWSGLLRSRFTPACSCAAWRSGRGRAGASGLDPAPAAPPHHHFPAGYTVGFIRGWLLCPRVCWACSEAPGLGGRWGPAHLGPHCRGALPFPAR